MNKTACDHYTYYTPLVPNFSLHAALITSFPLFLPFLFKLGLGHSCVKPSEGFFCCINVLFDFK